VNLDELEAVCREAVRGLLEREDRPLPTAVVLPLPGATKVTTFPEFPGDDDGRAELLTRFVDDVMRPAGAPCYGFVAEGLTAGGDEVVVVAYGARRHHPRVTAAPLNGAAVGDFVVAEDLDPVAMPFLAPLQQAAEAAAPPPETGKMSK
jgi:hypothetical protein